MRQVYYLIILFVFVLGISLSIIFFPNLETSSLMLLYDQQYEESYKRYQELYDQGDHSISVVMPLIKLDLEFAHNNEAIKRMELFVQEHPDFFEARLFLGELYKTNKRPYEYLQNLRELYRLAPQVEFLREELYLYHVFDDDQGQFEVLKEIYKRYRPLHDEYYLLSYLYATQGEMEKALEVMDRLFNHHHPAEIQAYIVIYAMYLYVQHDQVEKAETIAETFVEADPDPTVATAFAFEFLNLGLFAEAIRVLDILPDYQQSTDLVFNTRLSVLLGWNKLKQAYALMKKRFEDGLLSDYFINALLQLALEYKDNQTIYQVLEFGSLSSILESMLVRAIEYAITHQLNDFIQVLVMRLEDVYFKEHPLVAFILGLQSQPPSPEEEEMLYFAPKTYEWTDNQKSILARFYSYRGYRALARQLVAEIQSLEEIEDNELHSLAGLYMDLKMIPRGLELAEYQRAQQRKWTSEMEKFWVLLTAADGRTQEVLDWLARQRVIDFPLLVDTYQAALDYKQAFLAITLANFLIQHDPSVKHKVFLANAFIINEQEEAALKILEDLYLKGEPVTDDYISALAAVNKRTGLYGDKIRHLILRKLNTQSLSDEKRRQFAYILADTGSILDAEDIFLALAAQKPYDDPDVQALLALWGDKPTATALAWIEQHLREAHGKEKAKWIKHLVDINYPQLALANVQESELQDKFVEQAYVDALTGYIYRLSELAKVNPGYRQELRQMVMEQLRFKLTKQRLRELAYTLNDQKFKEEAAEIFLELAHNKPFADEDVQALLGLWGDKLTFEQTSWIEERALMTIGKEKSKWLKYLLDTHHAALVANLFMDEDLYEDSIVDVVIEALTSLKRRKEIGDLILSVLPFEDRSKRLHKLGKRARDEGQNEAALEVYFKLVSLDPKDSQALKGLGQVLFVKGSYSYAQFYLEAYFQEDPVGDYLSYYYYGDILKLNHWTKQANYYYSYALYLLDQLEKKDKFIRQIEAQLLTRLRKFYCALMIYEELVEKYPSNLNFRTDFANFLITLGEFEHAYLVLANAPCPEDHKKEEEDPESQINFLITRIRYLQEVKNFPEALCLSVKAMEQYPDKPQVLAAVAGVELAMGRWRRSIEFLHAAQMFDWINESYVRSEREIMFDYLPFFQVGGERRITGALQRETFRRLQAEMFPTAFTKVRVLYEQDLVYVQQFTFLNGVTGTFRGERERSEVSAFHYFDSGDIARASAYAATGGVVGGGIGFAKVDSYGVWDVLAEYHRPNWDYIQTTVEEGTVDRVRLLRGFNSVPRFEAFLAGSLNRYNLQGFSNAASTKRLEARASYTWSPKNWLVKLLGDDANINLVYTLDAEYILSVRDKFSARLANPPPVPETRASQIQAAVNQAAFNALGLGEEFLNQPVLPPNPFFQPFPLTSREDHILALSFTKRLSPLLFIDGYWGYLYNRVLGGPLAPTYGMSLFYGRRDWMMLHVEYDHGTSIQNNGTVDRMIVDFRYSY